MDALASRSPRWRTAPTETVVAHRIRRASVSGVPNRVSSTTLSMPSAPWSSVSAINGKVWSAWAAATHRLDFHSETP
jgi:hypothetical protein